MSSTGRVSQKKMGAMRITAYAEFSAMKRRCCVSGDEAVCSLGARTGRGLQKWRGRQKRRGQARRCLPSG